MSLPTLWVPTKDLEHLARDRHGGVVANALPTREQAERYDSQSIVRRDAGTAAEYVPAASLDAAQEALRAANEENTRLRAALENVGKTLDRIGREHGIPKAVGAAAFIANVLSSPRPASATREACPQPGSFGVHDDRDGDDDTCRVCGSRAQP